MNTDPWRPFEGWRAWAAGAAYVVCRFGSAMLALVAFVAFVEMFSDLFFMWNLLTSLLVFVSTFGVAVVLFAAQERLESRLFRRENARGRRIFGGHSSK